MSYSRVINLMWKFCFLTTFFINCSGSDDVKFEADSHMQFLFNCAADPKYSEDCPNLIREKFKKSFKASPTDILFVLDDSCSMATIAGSMASGFTSLASTTYPGNTKMGLTYMAPAKVESDGSLNLSTPYHSNVPIESAGFIKLVTKQSMNNYVDAYPEHESYFPEQGCNDEWFSPDQKGDDGNSCLTAVSQLAPLCTGVEAGLVTLEQTLKSYSIQGKRLFRENAFVNIIFVSDTHEPGANYFGRSGAPEKMKSYEEIISVINSNSPNISSLKMAGILPLPVEGHEIYDGLNVIGNKPQTTDEAYINAEADWDFSYLPFIKRTDGAVSHANSDDWVGIAQSLVEDSKSTGTLILNLKSNAIKIYIVSINNIQVPEDDWSISSDGSVITLKYSSDANTTLNIDVVYGVKQ